MTSRVIKKCNLLGGKVLDWRFVKHTETLVRIACALHNRYSTSEKKKKPNGCLDAGLEANACSTES